MKVTGNTKISELIKADKNSIDAISAISKPLEKLKNPVLRRLMASRVTIAEAARMGNASIAEFEKALKPLGFQFETDDTGTGEEETLGRPDWLLGLPAAKITNFDVRQMLSEGNDPLKEIMKKFKGLETGNALCIINTFVPTPLVRLLEKDNTLSYTETISEKEYHTYFFKQEKKKTGNTIRGGNNIFTVDADGMSVIRQKYKENGIVEIDVRHLEMPGPMQLILSELETLPDGKALFVHHKRIPIYLLEELESKKFTIHILKITESEVKLLIEKSN